nr:MAG TPA: hypothetical protein [Caudoviricetes sp.]
MVVIPLPHIGVLHRTCQVQSLISRPTRSFKTFGIRYSIAVLYLSINCLLQ